MHRLVWQSLFYMSGPGYVSFFGNDTGALIRVTDNAQYFVLLAVYLSQRSFMSNQRSVSGISVNEPQELRTFCLFILQVIRVIQPLYSRHNRSSLWLEWYYPRFVYLSWHFVRIRKPFSQKVDGKVKSLSIIMPHVSSVLIEFKCFSVVIMFEWNFVRQTNCFAH